MKSSSCGSSETVTSTLDEPAQRLHHEILCVSACRAILSGVQRNFC
ncbi:unnamed protein product [Timema podura]|uniref:Uncharacterized protein n=1 Tax=Timema podura TaxID=61482 RepID=A0ABN7PIX7_TIMPD|nr:unnamed protein product [Timema podura]